MVLDYLSTLFVWYVNLLMVFETVVLLFCRYIPTGVLFDLLCAEPERPWNLTVYDSFSFCLVTVFM